MKRKKSDWFIIIGIIIVASILVIINFNNKNFFKLNLFQIITLVFSAFLSFYLVQRFTDERRKIDCFEKVLLSIRADVCEDEIYFSVGKKSLLMQKSIANRIVYLKDCKLKAVAEELGYLESEFEEIRELYSNHNQTEESLQSINDDLYRHQVNITDKIDKIRLKIYGM